MKKYYNEHDIKEILSMIEIDPYEAKIRFEKYMNNYPKDYTTYAQYSFLLIRIGLFEEHRKTEIKRKNKYYYLKKLNIRIWWNWFLCQKNI